MTIIRSSLISADIVESNSFGHPEPMPTIEISPDGLLRKMDMLGLKVEWQGSMVAWASAKPRAIEEPHRGAEQPWSNNHNQDALIEAAICPSE